jgi:IclR family KDG regulon transcriptional repressor
MAQVIASLQKALSVVDAFASDGGELGISELARRLGLTKNQVFRVLKTLEEHGYVRQCETKTYRLGWKFFEIGQSLLEHSHLLELAPPVMDDLRDRTRESVHLLVRDGFEAVCVARRESPALIRMSARVGHRFLLHAGACPKAILAFQPPSYIDRAIERHGLPAYTAHTVTDRPALDRHLRLIRQLGFAESDEDIDIHAYAVAVPIFDRDGGVDAAMSVAGPLVRFEAERRAEALAALKEACDRISQLRGAPRRLNSRAPAAPEVARVVAD